MVMTRAQQAEALTHILHTVFDQPEDSPLERALAHNNIISPLDLISIGDFEYPSLDYRDDNNIPGTISRGNAGLLRTFKAFVAHDTKEEDSVPDGYWMQITREQFDQFCVALLNPTVPPPANTTRTTTTTTASDLTRKFRCGIRRDPNLFIPFRNDNAWDNWNRSTVAQAHAQDVSEVLKSAYKPSAGVQKELFDHKQKYMYAVFEKTLLTDKGKALVR